MSATGPTPNSRQRICIITNAPISHNPRVVKEADALATAGYDVRVIFAQHAAWTAPLDRMILDGSEWRGYPLRLFGANPIRWLLRTTMALGLRAARFIAAISPGAFLAEMGFSKFLIPQATMAARMRADLYIAHNPQSLPIAALAARFTRGRYGFDSEDLHSGEYPMEEADRIANRLLEYLERKYLPGCCYLTAASAGIAREIRSRYDVREPTVVLNVFPLAERPLASIVSVASCKSLSLYWYSQIAGTDRGLEDAIRAVGLLQGAAVLHIRGYIDETSRAVFLNLAREANARDYLVFYDPIPPDQLPASAAGHDVGLCLEQPKTVNKDVCIANKIFIYLLAGIPIVATSTKGHREIVEKLGEGGYLYPPGDHTTLASVLRRLGSDAELLARAKQVARDAADARWNWETEKRGVLHAVEDALS